MSGLHGYVYTGKAFPDGNQMILGSTFSTSKTQSKTFLHHANVRREAKGLPYFFDTILVRASIFVGEEVMEEES